MSVVKCLHRFLPNLLLSVEREDNISYSCSQSGNKINNEWVKASYQNKITKIEVGTALAYAGNLPV